MVGLQVQGTLVMNAAQGEIPRLAMRESEQVEDVCVRGQVVRQPLEDRQRLALLLLRDQLRAFLKGGGFSGVHLHGPVVLCRQGQRRRWQGDEEKLKDPEFQ